MVRAERLGVGRVQLPNCPMRVLTLLLATQEANYAHQQELDMIPLMMQNDYSPKGWLGLILGTRLWYTMHSALSLHCCRSCLSSLIDI